MSAVGYDRDFDRIPRTGPPLDVPSRAARGDGPDRAGLA